MIKDHGQSQNYMEKNPCSLLIPLGCRTTAVCSATTYYFALDRKSFVFYTTPHTIISWTGVWVINYRVLLFFVFSQKCGNSGKICPVIHLFSHIMGPLTFVGVYIFLEFWVSSLLFTWKMALNYPYRRGRIRLTHADSSVKLRPHLPHWSGFWITF